MIPDELNERACSVLIDFIDEHVSEFAEDLRGNYFFTCDSVIYQLGAL